MGSTEHPPLVSVIVPTYNRCRELIGLLECLEKQTLKTFEVIIIDDGSVDGTFEQVQQRVAQLPYPARFECQTNSGPGAARNRGAEHARADLLAFTDTDCRPFPDWLERMTEACADKSIGAVGGAEEVGQTDAAVMQAIHYCMTSRMTTGGMRGSDSRTLATYYPRTFNMAVRRDAFRAAGGFRKMYHGEDIELSYRIRQAGYHLAFSSSARVYHRRRCSVGSFFRQVLKMGRARVTLARLHPEMLEPLHVLPALTLLLFCALTLLAPLALPFLLLAAATYTLALVFFLTVGIAALVQTRKPLLCLLVPLLFGVQQSAYGIGFLIGCAGWISGSRLPD